MSEPDEGEERRPYQGEAEQEGEQPKKRRIDLSAPQVVAGGVATLTAATAASFLGVYGTIAGAAVMSVISTAGTAITQRFIEDGRDKAKETARAVADRSGRTVVRNPREATPSYGEGAAGSAPDPDVTRAMPTVDETVPATTSFAAGGAGHGETRAVAHHGDDDDGEDERTWWQRYRVYVFSAAALFVAVMIVILVFELLTGRSLSDTVRGEGGHSSPSLLGGVSQSEDPGGDTDTGDTTDTDGGGPDDQRDQDDPGTTDQDQPGGSNEGTPQTPEGGDTPPQEETPGSDGGSNGQPDEGVQEPAPQEGPGAVQPEGGGAE
ncbi:hypothetical protein J4H86_21025 [Spiractinospora alimapuensis]|uniref:hypothetical protein n=1 Tax=Spiractinospora alimapuensis TaxID=2820884 RepID=UPI001F2E96D7|nr:hypothetical protein [Spiractinospora alimapuensis]QVQ51278.1 hypothetical protein J4H86_21025 [Spiractinospora alimapuensis]